MIRLRNFSVLLLVLILSSCRQVPSSGASQDHLLQATLWYQHSAEMKALYYQAFNWAAVVLEREVAHPSGRPRAVVLDIDETVLDNSPQTGRQILDGVPFSPDIWDRWCRLEAAEALPGVLDFTLRATELGVEVFYISNRGDHLTDPTLANLQKLGFPNADRDHVLLKSTTSDKDARRAMVSVDHDLVMLIGDNLGDFSGVFDERADGRDLEEVERNREKFGYEFILLPNPMYGSWEKPYRGDSPAYSIEKKKAAIRAF